MMSALTNSWNLYKRSAIVLSTFIYRIKHIVGEYGYLGLEGRNMFGSTSNTVVWTKLLTNTMNSFFRLTSHTSRAPESLAKIIYSYTHVVIPRHHSGLYLCIQRPA